MGGRTFLKAEKPVFLSRKTQVINCRDEFGCWDQVRRIGIMTRFEKRLEE
jgi:hypothetical protein